MADRKDNRKETGKPDPGRTDAATPAREALERGDAGLARKLARDLLARPDLEVDVQARAREVLEATRIDWQPLVAGVVVLAVLALLFALVLAGRF